MIKVGAIISSEIASAKRKVKMQVMGKDDVQDVPQIAPHGIDSSPIKDARGLCVTTALNSQGVFIGVVNGNQEAKDGEIRIFSTDSDGQLQTFIHLHDDGTIDVGGTSDNMVRYSELETAFNQLKEDFNNLVTSYNSHTHITTATVGPTAVPGVIAPTISTGTPSTADITPAKIDEINTI
jgi:hypothetical protein